MGNYIPRGDEEFYDWSGNFRSYVLIYQSMWELPSGATAEINTAIGDYRTAYQTVLDVNHTTQDIEKKNEARAVAETAVRGFVNYHVNGNPKVTDDQRKVCGLPIYDRTMTPSPVPDMFPVGTEVSQPAKARIKIKTVDSKLKKKAKPPGVHGIELAYVVGPKPAEHVREMTHSLFSTRTTIVVQLTDEESAEYFSFFMRYENTRGEKGPWSPVYHVVVS
jgi:hypothetical protein